MRKASAGRTVPGVVTLFLIVFAFAGRTAGYSVETVQPKANALFAFGDSYADTGNRPKDSASWSQPYGITWPGYPMGRFSNGHIQTDFIAQMLGLPTPTLYVDAAVKSIETGINFAIGGSSVTYGYGLPPLLSQVDNFERVLETGAYSPSFLASSVVLVSNVGNDYAAFAYNTSEITVVIEEVVEGVAQALGRLYKLGMRNVLVANLPALNCIPMKTKLLNYTSCSPAIVPLIEYHNLLLQKVVQDVNKLPNANYIILDETSAFDYILNNSAQYGITEKLIPCCQPANTTLNCGDVDGQGNPLYTVCSDPAAHMWWDGVHPTQSTWQHITGLFESKPGYVLGAPTLALWLYENSLQPPAPSPAPRPVVLDGAVGQLENAYEALISEPDYLEVVGLLQAVDLDDLLAKVPDQTLTIFLPTNEAFFSLPMAEIAEIYGQDQVLSVASFHAVKGFYDSTDFVSGAHNLTTILGLPLLVTSQSGIVTVGLEAAKVVKPSLYKVPGQLVIHGIDQVLLPPTTMS